MRRAGWDLVGKVDRLGDDVSGIEPGQIGNLRSPGCAWAIALAVPRRSSYRGEAKIGLK